MKSPAQIKLALALAVALWPVLTMRAEISVPVATKPDAEWKIFSTRTIDDLPALPADSSLDQFGGLLARTEKATGFFHTAKIGDRWWLVDPVGGLFLNAGVASVKTIAAPGAELALEKKFGNKSGWSAASAELLHTNGFNGTGAWSEDDFLAAAEPRLAYTKLLGFMAGYGKIRGGTHMQPGHVGYPSDCIFVFDPAFEKFCDDYARQIVTNKNDPWLLGYFSDNEMPFPKHALTNFLALPENDPGHVAALKFLQARYGANAAAEKITAKDESDFLALVAEKYFSTVSRAIKKYDPNHLFLGVRFYAVDIAKPELFRACGPFVDVVSMNYYRAWTPDAATMQMWSRESGKPILITEWYAKSADSGLANTGGAGWLVKSQRERGLFYQNFALGLLESKVCVGWHWFRYSDNDPEEKGVDPSNRDSNKGIVNNRYEPYAQLLAQMKSLNEKIYSLTDYFDRTENASADKRLPGEKGD
jgi:hypothetical protein